MVLDLYYITAPRLWDTPGELGPSGVMAIPVGHATGADLKALYGLVSNWPVEQRFCLWLDQVTPADASLVEDLVAFFFLPNYDITAEVPAVLVGTPNPDEGSFFVNVLTDAAKAQGFASVLLHYFRAGAPGGIHVHHADAPDEIGEAYKVLLKCGGSRFFVKVEQPGAIGQVVQLVQEAEAAFRQQEPGFYDLLQENRRLQSRNQQLEELAAAAAREIAAQAAHMQVLRTGAQAVHLQHYYTNEYEVLPSWYKRFGHILKVVMGKRSLRSLFNDNVKKYKQ